jgi:chromosome segregation ATPase
VRTRLSELRRARDHLAAAKAEEDHQARRISESLERAGGRDRDSESRLSLLDEGRRLTAKALDKIEREIEKLEGRLAALEREGD